MVLFTYAPFYQYANDDAQRRTMSRGILDHRPTRMPPT